MNDRSRSSEDGRKTSNPDPNSVKKNTIRVDPATIVLVIVALLLIPLVITGFLAQ
jgi:hypothetical protein